MKPSAPCVLCQDTKQVETIHIPEGTTLKPCSRCCNKPNLLTRWKINRLKKRISKCEYMTTKLKKWLKADKAELKKLT